MTQNELLYICTVEETGSIAKAAEKLFVTRSAISHCLQKVENEIGTMIFTRTTSGMQTTVTGEIYIRYAKNILRQYDQLLNEIQNYQ